jgi:hypothetical protein
MSDPRIDDTLALIKMGTAQRILSRRLATMVLEHPASTPEMQQIAQVIAHPTPEHQPLLLAVADGQREVA